MLKKVIVRKATGSDIEQIISLNLELFKREYKHFDDTLDIKWPHREGKKYFLDKIKDPNGFLVVAERNGKLIGYLSGGLSDREAYRRIKKPAELENMIVSKGSRSKGVGGMLVKDFIRWCKSKKIDNILVIASSQNKRAINFYKNAGFKNYDTALRMWTN